MRYQTNFLILLFIIMLQAKVFSQDPYGYRERGNRYEGRMTVEAGAADLELLSCTSYRENVNLNQNVNLKLKFFVWKDTNLYITVKELIIDQCYFMNPIQERWPKGWQEFYPWPTEEVLANIGITPSRLGIVGRINNNLERSGTVIPIILYHSQPPSRINKYTFDFIASQSLDIIDFELYRIGQNIPIYSNQLRQQIGGFPFSIILDLSGQSSDFYELRVDCKYDNGQGGPQRFYFFYHKSEIEK